MHFYKNSFIVRTKSMSPSRPLLACSPITPSGTLIAPSSTSLLHPHAQEAEKKITMAQKCKSSHLQGIIFSPLSHAKYFCLQSDSVDLLTLDPSFFVIMRFYKNSFRSRHANIRTSSPERRLPARHLIQNGATLAFSIKNSETLEWHLVRRHVTIYSNAVCVLG